MRRMLRILTALFLAIIGLTSCGRREERGQIALTFDDLPVHGDLPPDDSRERIIQSILDTLQQEQLPPTYGFVNGSALESDPALLDTLQMWRSKGHPLANHTWSHPALSATTPEQFEADIARNEPLLQRLMDQDQWRTFRYPYLDEADLPSKHAAVAAWLKDHHYQVAQVTQDFGDYLWNPPYVRCATQHNDRAVRELELTYLAAAERQLSEVETISRLRYGRVIPLVVLLHVGAFDAHMLPRLIGLYRSHGFTFVTLEQAQDDPAYRGEPGKVLRRGASILNRLARLGDRLTHTTAPRQTDLTAICPVKS